MLRNTFSVIESDKGGVMELDRSTTPAVAKPERAIRLSETLLSGELQGARGNVFDLPTLQVAGRWGDQPLMDALAQLEGALQEKVVGEPFSMDWEASFLLLKAAVHSRANSSTRAHADQALGYMEGYLKLASNGTVAEAIGEKLDIVREALRVEQNQARHEHKALQEAYDRLGTAVQEKVFGEPFSGEWEPSFVMLRDVMLARYEDPSSEHVNQALGYIESYLKWSDNGTAGQGLGGRLAMVELALLESRDLTVISDDPQLLRQEVMTRLTAARMVLEDSDVLGDKSGVSDFYREKEMTLRKELERLDAHANVSAPEMADYPCELKVGLSEAEVMLYKQVKETCLDGVANALVKDFFVADYGVLDPAENYWAAFIEFTSDSDNPHPAFEESVGAIITGPFGNNFEVSSNTVGKVRLFGSTELELERQKFVEWKADRY